MYCRAFEKLIYDQGKLLCRDCYCPNTDLTEEMLNNAGPSCALGIEHTHSV